jgi:hypothetical protein
MNSNVEFIAVTIQEYEFQFDKSILTDHTKHIDFAIDMYKHITNYDGVNSGDSSINADDCNTQYIEDDYLSIIKKYNDRIVQVDISPETIINEPLSMIIKRNETPILFVKYLYKKISRDDIHSYINNTLGCDIELYKLPSKYL